MGITMASERRQYIGANGATGLWPSIIVKEYKVEKRNSGFVAVAVSARFEKQKLRNENFETEILKRILKQKFWNKNFEREILKQKF